MRKIASIDHRFAPAAHMMPHVHLIATSIREGSIIGKDRVCCTSKHPSSFLHVTCMPTDQKYETAVVLRPTRLRRSANRAHADSNLTRYSYHWRHTYVRPVSDGLLVVRRICSIAAIPAALLIKYAFLSRVPPCCARAKQLYSFH